jgi:hypothetical protein
MIKTSIDPRLWQGISRPDTLRLCALFLQRGLPIWETIFPSDDRPARVIPAIIAVANDDSPGPRRRASVAADRALLARNRVYAAREPGEKAAECVGEAAKSAANVCSKTVSDMWPDGCANDIVLAVYFRALADGKDELTAEKTAQAERDYQLAALTKVRAGTPVGKIR